MKIKKEGAKPVRPTPTWRVTAGPYKGEKAKGHTKAEARAELKKRYGLPRLPAGTTLEQVEGK